MQQNPSLLFDPLNATAPFAQIDVNNPPFVPNYQCEPQIQQYGPYCAGLLMIELQSAAQRNPLRMFAFNMYAANYWKNDDFLVLYGATMDYVACSLLADRSEGFRSPDEAIQRLAPRMVSLMVANNTQKFPALVNYIDQDTYQDVMRQVQFWSVLDNTLNNFRRQSPVFGYGPTFRPNQSMMMQPPMGGGYQQGGGYPLPQQHMPMQMGGANRMALQAAVGGGAQPFTRSLPSPDSSYVSQRMNPEEQDDPYARMRRNRESNQADVNQRAPAAVEVLAPPFNPRTKEPVIMEDARAVQIPLDDGSYLIPEAESAHIWRPTEEQPYRPVFHPSTQVRYHRIMRDGTVFVEAHDKQPNMDYEKHNLPNIFGKPREGAAYDIARSTQGFSRGAAEFAHRMDWTVKAHTLGDTDEGREAQKKADEAPVSVIVQDEWHADVSEVSNMLYAGVSKLQAAAESGTSPDVFRLYGYVAEPVLCVTDQSDLLRRLGESRTYLELAEKLNYAAKENDLGLVETVGRRSIQMLNRVLSLNLSIPPDQLSLGTDFDADTIRELEDALETGYSAVFMDAYRSQQRIHIESIFQHIDSDEIWQNLQDDLVDKSKFPEGKAPWVALLTASYSFTILDMYSHDLDLNLDAETGSLVTEQNSGDLYKVLVDLFTRQPQDKTFYRHLFQTNDGVVLEVTKGDIGIDAYLISRSPTLWFG